MKNRSFSISVFSSFLLLFSLGLKAEWLNSYFYLYYQYEFSIWVGMLVIAMTTLAYGLLQKNQAEASAEILRRRANAQHDFIQAMSDIYREFFPKVTSGYIDNQYRFTIGNIPIAIHQVCKLLPDRNFKCSLPFDQSIQIITKTLNIHVSRQLDGDLPKFIIDYKKINPKDWRSLNKQKILQTIRNEIYETIKQSEDYKLEKAAYEAQQVALRTKELQLQKRNISMEIKNIVQIMRDELSSQLSVLKIVVQLSQSAMQFTQQHWSEEWHINKRVQKPHEMLMKEINKFSEEKVRAFQTQVSEYTLSLDKVLVRLQRDASSLDRLRQLKSDLNSLTQSILNEKILSKPYATSLEQLKDEYLMAIEKHRQESHKEPKVSTIALTIEQRRAQRELQEQQNQEAEIRARQEQEEKKRQHQIHLQKQREQQALIRQAEKEKQERRRIAQLKAEEERKQKEEARRTQSSSSSSSTSIKPILKEKVLTLGDLIQRAETEDLNEQNRVQYRYSLLAQCLRLFELTDKYLHSKISHDLRNALMHQHRYFDLSALLALANFIAHKPNESASTSKPKFEDILIDLQHQPTPILKEKLQQELMGLTLQDFYQNYIQSEVEQPTPIQLLESLVHFLDDLSKLNVKLEQGLMTNPDKILAVQGILMCIGECYQKLRHVRQDDLLAQTQDDDLLRLLKTAKTIRDQMAHTVEDPLDNEGLYLKFLRQAESHKNLVSTLLETLQYDDLPQPESLKI